MEAKFIEKYDMLSDMKANDIAVSVDRKKFFVCGWHYDSLKKDNVLITLDINNLHDQYTDSRQDEPVRILKTGDKFHIKK